MQKPENILYKLFPSFVDKQISSLEYCRSG